MDCGATRVFVLRTTVPFRRTVALYPSVAVDPDSFPSALVVKERVVVVVKVVMDRIWVRLGTVMVLMDLWLCWFVVLHGGVDFGSFVVGLVVVLMVVFGGVAHGG
ncbi:transmembrane protein, putative [Medicago truncatula]|uniref:Transmembrane protein, putative n=1 Tax=Medicago truncatula TaxID=3880 RepID=G7IF87_MEDTR|nr:transmembrane protein, putative [Medicago truncatula]